nr:FtsX-like permease family protein [uncultured Sellimonas sp.]
MKRAAKIWRIILSLVVVILYAGVWRLPVGGVRYTLIGAWVHALQSDGYMKFWLGSSAGPTLAFCHILGTIAVLLYVARLILMIFHKEIHVLDLASRAMVFLCLIACIQAANAYEGTYDTALNHEQADLMPLLFVSIASLFEYVGFRFLDEWYEQMAAYREVKKKERAARLRRKQALYFPGRYPKELMILVWEDFRSSIKDGVLLILGGIFTAVFLIISFGVFLSSGNIPQIPGVPDWLLKLQGLFTGSTVMIIFLCVLLMYNLISNYTKVRNREYRTFLILGIRTRTIYLLFAVEFGVSMVASAILGLIVGGISYSLLRMALADRISLPHLFSMDILGWGGIAFLLILIFATMLNQENILRLGSSTVLYQEKEAEKVPSAVWGKILCGLALLYVGAAWYTSRAWTEIKGSYLFAALAVFLILTGFMVRSVRNIHQKPEKALKQILWNKEWRYRFKKNRWSIYLMTIVHICVLSFAGIPIVSGMINPKAEDQLPYDIVCMAYDQDMDRLTEIGEQYGAESQVYPMVRMTSVSGTSSMQDERMVSMDQGQYVGITEDTYRALKEALGKEPQKLDLKDGQIHTVYQQNPSMPSRNLDYSGSRTGSYMRFGQPLLYYSVDRRHDIYTGHEEVSRERDILTGVLGEGEEEHLVVLSDEEFERGYASVRDKNEKNMAVLEEEGDAAWEQYMMEHEDNLTDGPTNLILWNVPEENYDAMVSDLSFVEEEHPIDRMFDERIRDLYPKQEMIGAIKKINVRDLTTQAVAAALLFVFGMFQIYAKTQNEAEAMEAQNLFLIRLGMKKKDRKRLMHRQIHRPFWISAVGGVLIELLYALLTFDVRSYSGSDMLRYTAVAAVVTVIYYLIWELWLTFMERKIWKEAESKR